jgi:hypothetical protein
MKSLWPRQAAFDLLRKHYTKKPPQHQAVNGFGGGPKRPVTASPILTLLVSSDKAIEQDNHGG